MDKKTTIILIIAILALGTLIYFLNIRVYKFKVVFFNAGNADSSLITYKDTTIIIDTGEEDFYDKLDSYLYVNKINKIDYLIITNFDKEHVGGASKLIDNYEIGSVYQTNLPKDSEYYLNYVESLKKKNIEPITVSKDMDINIDRFSMSINGPDKYYEEDQYNNSSLIVSMKYKNKSFLFMGDAMNERIEDYVNSHPGAYKVIKMPHHNDYLKNDELLIDKYKPSEVVISADTVDKKLQNLLEDKNIEYTVLAEKDANTEYVFKEF